jgi:hypothetical protein
MSDGPEILPEAAGDEPMLLDTAMIAALFAVAGCAVLLALGALIWAGPRAALGVAIGGAIATANLWLLAHILRGTLSGGPWSRLWSAAGGLKMLVLMGGAWLLIRSEVVSGLMLVVGYAALPLGATLGPLLRPRPNEDQENAAQGSAPKRDLVSAAPSTQPHGD